MNIKAKKKIRFCKIIKNKKFPCKLAILKDIWIMHVTFSAIWDNLIKLHHYSKWESIVLRNQTLCHDN